MLALARGVALSLLAIGCGGARTATTTDADAGAQPSASAPVATFTPPSPRGCAGAAAYDYCFAFDGATPLAVRLELARATGESAVGAVRFRATAGSPAAVLDSVTFALAKGRAELVYYFEVYPATYTVEVEVAGDQASTPPLDIGGAPVETWLTVP
jgi:hypothetical protein